MLTLECFFFNLSFCETCRSRMKRVDRNEEINFEQDWPILSEGLFRLAKHLKYVLIYIY